MSAVDTVPTGRHGRTPHARTEDGIHRSIVHYMRHVLPHAVVLHVPNGGSRNKIEASKLKGLGVLAGAPDLLVMLPRGEGLWIEVKAPKRRLSPAQHAFADKCVALNWPCVIARSVDDVKAALKALNIKTREVS